MGELQARAKSVGFGHAPTNTQSCWMWSRRRLFARGHLAFAHGSRDDVAGAARERGARGFAAGALAQDPADGLRILRAASNPDLLREKERLARAAKERKHSEAKHRPRRALRGQARPHQAAGGGRGGATDDLGRGRERGTLGRRPFQESPRALARADRRRGALAERLVHGRGRVVGADGGAPCAVAPAPRGLRQIWRFELSRDLGPADLARGRFLPRERRVDDRGGAQPSPRRAGDARRALRGPPDRGGFHRVEGVAGPRHDARWQALRLARHHCERGAPPRGRALFGRCAFWPRRRGARASGCSIRSRRSRSRAVSRTPGSR